jgi:hypothetical protein
MRQPTLIALVVALLAAPGAARATAQISRSVVGAGGGTAVGATIAVRSSIGQALAGSAGSAHIAIAGGFWLPGGGSTGLPGEDLLPASFRFRGNHPNPFNPHTTLAFDLPQAAARVTLRILDAQGRQMGVLVDGPLPAGRHQVVWDGRDARGNACSSGLYLSLLETPTNRATGKLTLLR